MQIILSPAKTMRDAPEQFPGQTLPAFLPQTETLLRRLRELSEPELKALWKCSDPLVRTNQERLARMDLRRGLTAAVFAYEGIQYRCLGPETLDRQALDYLSGHLRILSGFYGLLRPFDGIAPYRLEMQSRLPVGQAKDLYQYWGGSLAARLCAETDCILDLASKEYSRSVAGFVPAGVRRVTCVFGEQKNGKLVEKSTRSKMLRGSLARYLAQQQAAGPEQAQAFCAQGCRFAPELSSEERYVFLCGECAP